MPILDVGGGFPRDDLEGNPGLVKSLQSLKNDLDYFHPIAEPGMLFAGNSSFLVFRIAWKTTKNGRNYFYTNESMYHSFSSKIFMKEDLENQFYSVFDENGKKINNDNNNKIELKPGALLGVTGEEHDVIIDKIMLPDFNVGDWIVCGGIGSYCLSYQTNFAQYTTLEKRIVYDGKIFDE